MAAPVSNVAETEIPNSAAESDQITKQEEGKTKQEDVETGRGDISPDPEKVICPLALPCNRCSAIFSQYIFYAGEVVIVVANLVFFIEGLSSRPEIWLEGLPASGTAMLMGFTTTATIFLVHKLVGRFRGEGLRADDQVPDWQKRLPAVIFSHEPLNTPCLVVFVPIFYVFLVLCILLGVWTSALSDGLLHSVNIGVTAAIFCAVALFELHHTDSEVKRVQPAACWAFSTFLLAFLMLVPAVAWWLILRTACGHAC
ncbi:unnamed protein product [Symbiodinium natans]|uniref:Uncharacterized protein n=1 Tax=Symbiodinium natans TaxID=878477 RepID=A0A812V7I6_9DINO|nr:unnamed protein product [Symbiodinium natans]